MKTYLNLVKANLALWIKNLIQNSVLLCFSITLPLIILLILSADIDLFAVSPLVVHSLEVSSIAI